MALRWEDERYVRLYTRNLPEWLDLSWQARGLFALLLREVDRAGILPLGRLGLRGLARTLRAEWEEIEGPLQELLDDGCVQFNGTDLVIPNFLQAQETRQSDAQRKRDQREKARAVAVSETTECHTQSPEVTASHQESPRVTPSLAVLSLTEPSLTKPKGADGGDPAAIRVLDALNAARKRVIPGARSIRPADSSLRHIGDRLREGYSLEDCDHVIAVCEAEVRADDSAAKWFDAVTPFRPDNFARKLGRQPPRDPQRERREQQIRQAEEMSAKARKPKENTDA